MSARRVARSTRVKPNKVRDQEFEEVRESDSGGRIVLRHRTVDSLTRLLRAGTITQGMHAAGRAFQRDFQFAGLDPIRARPMMLPARGGGGSEVTEGQLDAKRRVHRALEALGGIGSPAGSCIWHVLGCGRSIREWAIRQAWNGRPSDQKEAKGILIAALGMLAGHYGHSEIGERPQSVRRPEVRSQAPHRDPREGAA